MKPCELIGNIVLSLLAIVGSSVLFWSLFRWIGVQQYTLTISGVCGLVSVMLLANLAGCDGPVEEADDTLGIGA